MEDYNSKNNKGLVSIIIPMYNAEDFSSAMIESIIAQTYANWELIIVDDGSTDNSINIVRSYESEDNRIKLIRRSDEIQKGAPSCRNIGIQNSNGEFIIFFDADDYIAPYCLSQRVEFMNDHTEYDFAIFPMLSFKKELLDTKNVIWGYKQDNNVLNHFITGAIPFVVVTNIYRRSSIINKELYWDTNLKSLQDSGYNIMALQKDCSFIFSNLMPDYFYRIGGNNNSISKKIKSNEHFLTRLYFYKKITSLFIDNHKYRSELLILTNVHFKYLSSDINQTHIEEFLSSKFFKKYKMLKFKLRLLYKIITSLNIERVKIRNMVIALFAPIFEIRQYIHYRSFYQKNNIYYNEIINKYYSLINELNHNLNEKNL